MAPTPHETDPVEVLQQLVRIDSVNPSLVPGGAGEAAIAAWCTEWMRERGFEVHTVGPTDRPSVVGILRGSGAGDARSRTLLLNGHLDTVGVAGYDGDPFAADIARDESTGGKVFGRGTFDMKGGVAAIMVAAARSQGLRGDVIVTLVADEEFGSAGTEAALAFLADAETNIGAIDAAIVTEPTEMNLVLAHRGFAWFEIELSGRASHGSMPHQGVDAIAHAGHVLHALDVLRERIESEPAHPLLGYGAVRVSMISGGTDAATVPDSCTLTIERRTMPGETPDDVEAELRMLLQRIGAEVPEFRFELRRLVARGAMEADSDSEIARTLGANAARVLGQPATVRGEPYWTDAGLIADAGIPCLLIGVDGGGAHANIEWATTQSVQQLTDILEGTIRDFLA